MKAATTGGFRPRRDHEHHRHHLHPLLRADRALECFAGLFAVPARAGLRLLAAADTLSYYNEYAPMPQQPMQAPVAKSSSSGKGLLLVAGLAVVGAAAFGGVILLNSNDAQPTSGIHQHPRPPLPPGPRSSICPRRLTFRRLRPRRTLRLPYRQQPDSGSREWPRVRAEVRSPCLPRSRCPRPAPRLPLHRHPPPHRTPGPGVSVKTPFAEVGVPGQGGVSVKTPGVEVGVPGQNGGDVVVAVPGPQTAAAPPPRPPAAASGHHAFDRRRHHHPTHRRRHHHPVHRRRRQQARGRRRHHR